MLLGMLLLATTLWIFLDENMLTPITEDMEGYSHVIYFLMAVAFIMTVMGFLGCCGALQESQCMLATFFSLVLVLFVGQVATGVWLHQHQEHFKGVVEKSAAQSIQHDYSISELKTKAFDVIQKELQCCGATGPQDWAESRFNNADSGNSVLEIGVGLTRKLTQTYRVPASCCKPSITPQACDAAREAMLIGSLVDVMYTDGCASKMVELIEKHDYVALAVILAILLTEVMAMVFSMVLCCAVRRVDHFKA